MKKSASIVRSSFQRDRSDVAVIVHADVDDLALGAA